MAPAFRASLKNWKLLRPSSLAWYSARAATNAVTHGNGSDPGKTVTVTFTLEPDALRVTVRDQGPGFDFEHPVDPRLLENRFKSSGRGLLLIRSFVDEVSYDHAPGRGTEIRMVKHLGG